jgi:CelD/BcsL family acetyltransferase involved in cellulose biosynthesis
MALTTKVIEDEAGIEEVRAAWDALAVAARRPYCAPGWMLAWWRHCRPRSAALRVLAAFDGDELIGIAPLFAADGDRAHCAYEFLTGALSPPVGPLAAAAREGDAIEALASAAVDLTPRPTQITTWLQPDGDPVAAGLSRAWPGRRPWLHSEPPIPSPVVDLGEAGFDAWFAGRSSKFRAESRRLRRRLDEEGATFAAVGEAELGGAVEAFVALNGDRWKDRGGSGAVVAGLPQMLADAFAELAPVGRLRIFTINVDGAVIAVTILLAAGGEVCGWNSGFDHEWRRFSPSLLLTLHAIEDAAERGDARVNMGPGDAAYKRRFADAAEEIAKVTSVAKGPSYLWTRLRLEGKDLRGEIGERLPPEARERLRRLLRR